MNDRNKPSISPNVSINVIVILWINGIIIICSEFNIHIILVPVIMEIRDIIIIGIIQKFDIWFVVLGLDLIIYLFDNINIRIEYEAVIPTDIIIVIISKDSIFDEIIFSIIMSFEKKPDIKGNPINDIIVIPKIEDVKEVLFIKLILIIRPSWYDDSWIIIPAHKNIVDLNKAWIIKCKNANVILLIEIANIIIAICLSVDKAIIFFKSCSQLADILAYKVVALEIIIIISIELVWMLFIIRILKNTPAVTKVEEWTKAEIGVGAAMAIGSHAENGYCALFEHAAVNNKIIVIVINSSFIVNVQFLIIIIIAIDIKIIISPTRFLNKVIDPDAAVK